MSTAITDKYLRRKIRKLKKSAAKHRGDIRPGRRRFGVYRYLRDIYELYLDLRSRRIARKATRRISKIFQLSIQRRSHPIRILIEASAGPEDARQKSRWSQALKYAYGWRQSVERLEWFFQTNGGISGSARKYAVNKKIARRKKDGAALVLRNSRLTLAEASRETIARFKASSTATNGHTHSHAE
jgi:hypothetical protein